MFIDSVEVTLRAGKGGDGIVSWRREKFVPKGGPDGGDGARGGSIILRASDNMDTLTSFRYRKVFQAEDGGIGTSKKMSGRSGEDLELLVPTGTQVWDTSSNKVLYDLDKPGKSAVIVQGGQGGLGNVHFATATNRQPMESTKGEPGEVIDVKLELQLIADIALIGLPNAGKSSIITSLTEADSLIGAYPFSTTHPVLGVMRRGDAVVTLVDLPGLIEGAHKGRGLGDKFLQHAKRVKALVQVVDATDEDISKSIKTIQDELMQFDKSFREKECQLVFNKIDLLQPEELKTLKKKYPEVIFISAQNQENTKNLADKIVEIGYGV